MFHRRIMYTQKQNPPTILNKSRKEPTKGNHNKLVLFPYKMWAGYKQATTTVDDAGEVPDNVTHRE